MNFEDEHYVRIYTRDTKTWKRWGWEGQTVFMHVMRKLDKAGVMDDIDDPVPDVALMTGLPESVVEVGLPKVLGSGALEINGTALVAPKYIEAQTAAKSDAQRQRERREKRRAEARRVTKRDGSVTEGHELSRAVTARPGSFPDVPEVPQSDPGADDRDVTKHDAPVTERDGCITDPVESVTRCHDASTSTTQGISVQSRAGADAPHTPRSGSSRPQTRRPTSMPEALRFPIAERAQLALEWADVAEWSAPECWPEVVEAAKVCAAGMGIRPPKLGAFKRDAGVRAIVGLFADGYTLDDFREAAEAMPSDEWLRPRRGLAALTPEVMRRLLNANPPSEPDAIVWEGG